MISPTKVFLKVYKLEDALCSQYKLLCKVFCQKKDPNLKINKKGKVLGTGVIKVNNHITVKDVALVDKLIYNLLSVSQLVDADLDVLLHKSGSKVLDSRGDLVCGISRIRKVFKADFSFVQSSTKCLISRSSSKL
jgi:hypothetical protein